MSRRSFGRLLENACWSFGAAAVLLYFVARAHGEGERREAIAAFEQAIAVAQSPIAENPAGPRAADGNEARAFFASQARPDQSTWSEGRISAYVAAESDPSGSNTLPAAVLRIPAVDLEVPVYDDISERNLNRGAGLVDGTARPGADGNIAIAAHRDGYFRALEDVVMNDILELQSSTGALQSYRVSGLYIVEPTDIWPLDDTEVSAVTLVTCYPFYFVGSAPQRYIVRAVAVDAVE